MAETLEFVFKATNTAELTRALQAAQRELKSTSTAQAAVTTATQASSVKLTQFSSTIGLAAQGIGRLNGVAGQMAQAVGAGTGAITAMAAAAGPLGIAVAALTAAFSAVSGIISEAEANTKRWRDAANNAIPTVDALAEAARRASQEMQTLASIRAGTASQDTILGRLENRGARIGQIGGELAALQNRARDPETEMTADQYQSERRRLLGERASLQSEIDMLRDEYDSAGNAANESEAERKRKANMEGRERRRGGGRGSRDRSDWRDDARAMQDNSTIGVVSAEDNTIGTYDPAAALATIAEQNADKYGTAAEKINDANQKMAESARELGSAYAESFGNMAVGAIEMLASGTEDAGKRALKAISSEAKGESLKYAAKGIAAVAEGIFGNPAGFAAAPQFFAASAAYGALAGVTGAMSGGGGGGKSGAGGGAAPTRPVREEDRSGGNQGPTVVNLYAPNLVAMDRAAQGQFLSQIIREHERKAA